MVWGFLTAAGGGGGIGSFCIQVLEFLILCRLIW